MSCALRQENINSFKHKSSLELIEKSVCVGERGETSNNMLKKEKTRTHGCFLAKTYSDLCPDCLFIYPENSDRRCGQEGC